MLCSEAEKEAVVKIPAGTLLCRLMLRATIHISDVELDALVGVFTPERHQMQPLRVDAELDVDVSKAALQERLSLTVDYVGAQQLMLFVLEHCRFRLLETAARVLATLLLAKPDPCEERGIAERLRLRLTKPGALDGRGVPSVMLETKAMDVPLAPAVTALGQQQWAYHGKDAHIYRYVLEKGSILELDNPRHSVMVLTEGVSSSTDELPPHTVLIGNPEFPTRIEVTRARAVVLAIDRHYDDPRHQSQRTDRSRRPSLFPPF